MSDLDDRLGRIVEERKRKGRYRTLKEYDTSSSSGLVDFSSNDYLSLTTSTTLRKSYLKRLNKTPQILGSTGSRLLSGSTKAHTSLENRFKEHFSSPSALLFNSGWDANVSFFATIPQSFDWVVFDELVHASVHSGMRSSRVGEKRRRLFRHNEPESLRQVLREVMNISTKETRQSGQKPTIFVALESLYSMDGDFAPLPALLDVLDVYVPRSQQCVVLDEAHSTGVYGHQGRGIAYALREAGPLTSAAARGNEARGQGRVGVRLMTFGKAVGCSGAVLLCSPTIRTFLINFARPLIFSTALPHSTLIALESAWDLLTSEEGDRRRQSLSNLAKDLHVLLEPLLARTPSRTLRLPPPSPTPFPHQTSLLSSSTSRSSIGWESELPPNPPSPIHALLSSKPHALSAFLLAKGFIVRPVVPPTVPPGGERVRICLRAEMTRKHLEGLVRALEQWVSLESGSSDLQGTTSAGHLEDGIMVKAKL